MKTEMELVLQKQAVKLLMSILDLFILGNAREHLYSAYFDPSAKSFLRGSRVFFPKLRIVAKSWQRRFWRARP